MHLCARASSCSWRVAPTVHKPGLSVTGNQRDRQAPRPSPEATGSDSGRCHPVLPTVRRILQLGWPWDISTDHSCRLRLPSGATLRQNTDFLHRAETRRSCPSLRDEPAATCRRRQQSISALKMPPDTVHCGRARAARSQRLNSDGARSAWGPTGDARRAAAPTLAMVPAGGLSLARCGALLTGLA